MAKTTPTLNLLVDLTKRIQLRPNVTSDAAELSQFMVPRDPSLPFQFFAGSLVWWAADDFFLRVDGFVNYLIDAYSDLSGGDTKSFRDTFLETLQRHAFDPALFDRGKLIARSVTTLFEARSEQNVDLWRQRLWDTLHQALRDSLRSWLVIYPLHPFTGKAFELGHDGISIIDSDDTARWAKLTATYPTLSDWSPRGGFRTVSGDDLRLYGGSPSRWLACEVEGTAAGATNAAATRMWTFVALLLAHFRLVSDSVLLRLQANTPFMCGQFSSGTATDPGMYTQRQIGPLLPHQVDKLNVGDELIDSLRSWYAARGAADDEYRRRASVASHFVLYGINAELTEERYIHFFIALDALFGDRGRVEFGIRDGILQLRSASAEWLDRIAELYDLRNDLVHGSASRIETWKGLEKYVRRFKSEPLSDVSATAMDALMTFFVIRGFPLRRTLRVRLRELWLDVTRAWRRFVR